ncbi:hypothetical protein [Saccharospirillum sp.]|uniref:hypothetical protein n=1 Tax=Saccharospirillum sp. TaxID=2033801 RepID=UPI0034A050E9
MFIDGLTEPEKQKLAVYLRERDHTPFMVIKHAYAAVQCQRRGVDIHPIDFKYLMLLDEAITELHDKYRIGSALIYDEPRTHAGQGRA